MPNFADLWEPAALTGLLAGMTTLGLLIVGLPLAWWLARRRQGLLVNCVAALVTLPLVLPGTVLGFYLLLLLGVDGPGGWLARFFDMRSFAFSFTGLLIGSMIYALPFMVQPLRQAFIMLDGQMLAVAATLRASPLDRFWTLALPMSRPALISACVLTFAHTVGEFGLVLMIGGNIPGETRVLSIALFDFVETFRWPEAHWLSASLVLFSFCVVLLTMSLERRPYSLMGPLTPHNRL